MSILTKEAAVLRASAERLEAAQRDVPQSARDLLRRFGPDKFCYRREVNLFELSHLVNDDGAGYMRHVIKRAGIELGVKIGEKLQTEYKGLQPGSVLMFAQTARYEAELYVMTPAEIEKLLQLAFRAGRESL